MQKQHFEKQLEMEKESKQKQVQDITHMCNLEKERLKTMYETEIQRKEQLFQFEKVEMQKSHQLQLDQLKSVVEQQQRLQILHD